MLRDSIVSKLESLPTGYFDCILSTSLSLRKGYHATLFSVYALTLQADSTAQEKFYTGLRHLLRSTPTDDKVFILGDVNARVGQDSEICRKGVSGKHGVGNCNANGHLVLEFCTELQLTITNTIYQLKISVKNNLNASMVKTLAPSSLIMH